MRLGHKYLKFDEYNWRWMLGLETLPAILYFFALFFVPRSPRWLAMKGKFDEALAIMKRTSDEAKAKEVIDSIKVSMSEDHPEEKQTFRDLFQPALRLVLMIGVIVAVLQQITGINSVSSMHRSSSSNPGLEPTPPSHRPFM